MTPETVIVASLRADEISQVIVTSPAASLLVGGAGAVASATVHVGVVLVGEDNVTATVVSAPVKAAVVVPVNVNEYT